MVKIHWVVNLTLNRRVYEEITHYRSPGHCSSHRHHRIDGRVTPAATLPSIRHTRWPQSVIKEASMLSEN